MAVSASSVTLLFTDIEGSTRVLRRTGEAYPELLDRHRALLREAFERHRGQVLATEGDEFFVAFESAGDAVVAAAEGQRALAGEEWPDGGEIRVRMGLHTGEPRPVDGGYVGLDVHLAARVMAAGHGGQVLVSEATRSLLRDMELRDLGEHLLKDLTGPQRLYQLEIDGLPADFPPLNTLDNRFASLPVVPNAFVGRERELAQAGELLARDDVRLLTLIGPGGTGKTRLALQLAAEASERFSNGAVFVQLAPVRDPDLVLPAIVQALGLREQPGESALEALDEYLRDKELLLVLDNLEQVLAAAPALASLLGGARGLKLLATSRTPLRLSGEHAYQVPQLALGDAVELFVERAQATAADFGLTDENSHAVEEICRRLDGLPLAIELAAPRVRTLTPQTLLRRLDQRLSLLTGGAQDADERQRTLRNTIAWSYDLLLEREQALFRRLAVFVGGLRLEAAAAVGDSADVLDDLDSLVEKSLLLRLREDSDGEPRFWMLETIREYALEQLEAAGELESAVDRHGSWFARLAECLDVESETGDQPASVARLTDDYPNLRAAIERARERPDGELLLRLATALWPYWSTYGYVAEGRRALEDGLELAGRRPARALLGLSSLRVFSGNSEGLLDDVHEVLRAAEELGDPLTLAQAWNLLGRVQGTLLGTLASAEEAWQQALEHAERADLRAERAEAIGWLMMAANFGPLPVEEGIARCRRFHEEAGDDQYIRGNALVELGALEAMRGNFTRGRELLGEGLETIAVLGFSLREAMSAQEAFYVEMLAGDLDAAERIAREAYVLLEQMGERSYLSSMAALLAHALSERGELDEAEQFSRVSEDAAAADDAFSQVLWRSGRAKTCARRGELAEAEALAREAVAVVETTDLLNTRGDTLADLGDVLALAGRPAEAAEVYEQAAEAFRSKGNLASLERVRQAVERL